MMFWVAAALVPFIAGFQRFAVAYGYEGVDRPVALRSAVFAFGAVAVLDALFVLAKISE